MINRPKITDSKIPNDSTIEYYFQGISNAFQRIINGKKINLYYLKDNALNIAITNQIKNTKKSVFFGVSHYLQIGIAHFHRVLASTEQVLISIDVNEFIIPKEVRKNGTDMYSWFELLNAAILLRDSIRQQQLIELNAIEWNKEGDPFWIKMGLYMIALLGGDRATQLEQLQGLRKESSSGMGLFHGIEGNKIVHIEGRSKNLQRLRMPVVELYELAIKGDTVLFNQQLEGYLLDKKAYIIENEKEDDPRFWIDFPLLACCAYAHDLGIDIKIESEYIPAWVYRGEFET